MKGVVIAMISLVLVVALVLVGVLVMGLNGALPFFGENGFTLFGSLDLANRQVFAASDFKSIMAEYSFERITLLVGDGDEIVLEEYMSKWDDRMLARVNTTGGKLDIRQGERPIGFAISWRCEIKLYVPAAYAGDVKLATSSGSIRAEDDFSFGSFAAMASSGSVHVQDMTCEGAIGLSATSGSVTADSLAAGGDVRLKASSGSIRPGTVKGKTITAAATSGSVRMDAANADTVAISTSSGSISVNELNGTFDLSNSSGSIRVEGGAGHGRASNNSGGISIRLDGLTGDLDLSTSSGSCKLWVPAGTGFALEAQTSSGSIHTPDDGGLSFNQKGNQVSGKLGGGGEFSVKMRATSGSVRVEYS